jgi:hypothetical protein
MNRTATLSVAVREVPLPAGIWYRPGMTANVLFFD